jgi:acetyltransferase-like isoleucine patch superfamily enzyme
MYGPTDRVTLGEGCKVSNATLNANSGAITIGDYAMIGEGVKLLTGTHDVSRFGLERQDAWPKFGRDIVVGSGVWIATDAIVLGPCVIGEHAVVCAGSVVTHDVPAFAVVAGVPARVVRTLHYRQGT